MFHRPKTTTTSASEGQTGSSASTVQETATQSSEDNDVKSVMKSPASFLQTQQTVNTQDKDETTKEEENKTMDVKEETVENTSDVSAPAFSRGTNYNASTASYGTGSTFSASSTTSTNYDRDTGRKLVVGQGINMSGEIDSCDHLIVEGTVEAALKGAAILDIYEQGTFFGTVEIQEATISGKFEGDLVVHGRLTLRSSAEVSGTIAYGELSVEAGAQMQGMIRPTSAMAQEAAKPVKKKTPTKKLKAANNASSEEDTQLPFASDAATA